MNEEKEVIAKVVSVKTGEVIDEIFSGDRILKHEKQKKKNEYLKTHMMNFNKGASFVKMYCETATILSKTLTARECQFVMGLLEYVSYEDCFLRVGNTSNRHFLELNEIAELMEIEYKTCSRIMNSLVKKGVIGIFSVGNKDTQVVKKIYTMNPYVCINGCNPECDTVKLFEETGWKEFIEEYYRTHAK